MNLMEEGFQEKETKKKSVATKVILGAIIILVIAIIGVACYLFYIQNNTLKLVLDGQANDKLKQLLQIEADGTVYMPIKDVASYFGYESYNGEYTEKSEQSSKCYVQNEKEVANFSLGSNQIYKLDLSSTEKNYEYAYAKNPVKAIEGKLYATSEMIEKAFNISFQYDQNKNRITIYTMPYLIQTYSSKILDYGYTEISDVFANQKTVLQDMLVVKNDKNKYALINVQGKAILEAKYDNITFLPTVGDFLVETNEKNKKVGILSKTGQTKIQINYDSIALMDSNAELYVVKKDNKYGVMDFNGNLKISIENDEVGMNISQFEQNNIKSKYLLVDNLIPVRKDKLWGLYDKNGKQVVDFKYDSFGYVASNNKNAINLLIIPDYNVLVAKTNNKYTLLNSSGQELFAPVADAIYMTISGGEKHYWILANNQEHDAEELLERSGITSNSNSNNTNSNGNSNNTNSNNTNSNNTNSNNQNQTTNNSTVNNTNNNEVNNNKTSRNDDNDQKSQEQQSDNQEQQSDN